MLSCVSRVTVNNYGHLLLRRRAELLSLACGKGCGHVERLHDLVVTEALVFLEPRHKVISKRHHRLHAVTHLTVAQVLQ